MRDQIIVCNLEKSTDGGGLGANCIVWLEVSFLGASSNALALYKSSDFTASVGFDAWFQKATALEPSGRFEDAPGMIAALSEVFEADEAGPKTERGEPVEF